MASHILTESFNPKLSVLNLTAVLSAGCPILFIDGGTLSHTHPSHTQSRKITSDGASVISTEAEANDAKRRGMTTATTTTMRNACRIANKFCSRCLSATRSPSLSAVCVWVSVFCNPSSALFFSSRRILSYVMQTTRTLLRVSELSVYDGAVGPHSSCGALPGKPKQM